MNVIADPLTAARAEALFTSHLPAGSTPSYADVDAAIRAAIRARGGTRAVAGDVAAAYGDHPETAVPRMRWARCVVDQLYGSRRACAMSGAR